MKNINLVLAAAFFVFAGFMLAVGIYTHITLFFGVIGMALCVIIGSMFAWTYSYLLKKEAGKLKKKAMSRHGISEAVSSVVINENRMRETLFACARHFAAMNHGYKNWEDVEVCLPNGGNKIEMLISEAGDVYKNLMKNNVV